MVKENNDGCIFCKISSGKIKEAVIAETDNFFAVNDIKPTNPGHCLIIPKKHYGNLLELPSSLGSELLDFTKEVAMKKIKEQKASGFNVVMNNFKDADQLVMHAHIHLIPRYKNDGFKLCLK